MNAWSLRRYYLTALAAVAVLAGGWIAIYVYVFFDIPLDNRAYAETWRGAPLSELLQSQGRRNDLSTRSDHAPGNSIYYSFNGWRGMRGRTYPGTFLASIVGYPRMESGTLFTPPADVSCRIEFLAGIDGIIDDVIYSGNDCD
jgi:hypothetical protein